MSTFISPPGIIGKWDFRTYSLPLKISIVSCTSSCAHLYITHTWRSQPLGFEECLPDRSPMLERICAFAADGLVHIFVLRAYVFFLVTKAKTNPNFVCHIWVPWSSRPLLEVFVRVQGGKSDKHVTMFLVAYNIRLGWVCMTAIVSLSFSLHTNIRPSSNVTSILTYALNSWRNFLQICKCISALQRVDSSPSLRYFFYL